MNTDNSGALIGRSVICVHPFRIRGCFNFGKPSNHWDESVAAALPEGGAGGGVCQGAIAPKQVGEEDAGALSPDYGGEGNLGGSALGSSH